MDYKLKAERDQSIRTASKELEDIQTAIQSNPVDEVQHTREKERKRTVIQFWEEKESALKQERLF